MRILALMAFFICCYFQYRSGRESVEHDSLNTRQSAIKKIIPSAKPQRTVSMLHDKVIESSEHVAFVEDIVPAEENNEDNADEDLSAEALNVPWSEIEEGWKTELKNYLTEIDPDRGEEIYNSYLEEKQKFADRVDFSERNSEFADDGENSNTPVVEYDGKTEEMERLHQENLQDIFGDHYPQVKSLHQEYVDSIQYMNRSELKFSISL